VTHSVANDTAGVKPRLLLNPASSRGRGAARLAVALREERIDVVETTSPEEMTRRARHAVDDGHERVIVAGGDGAVHYAIQGLAGSDCALGIVPVGSGNDLARALGIDAEPGAALRQALHGSARKIDLGRIGTRVFAGVVGLGIDGDVCRIVGQQAAWIPGPAAYAYSALRSLASFRPPSLIVEYEGGSYSGPVLLAGLANSPLFGGGMRIAPGATLDDGCLDLVIVEPVPFLELLSVFPRVYRGSHLSHPAVHSARVRKASFLADRPRTFYADGEPLMDSASDPTDVEVWPGALQVIA
jgi:diacylglycerol kinase (ATP)